MAKALQDRIALVTGASRGIGRAVALRFAAEGATVIALARTSADLETLDDEITKLGGNCVLIAEDLTDYPKIDQIGAALHERFGKLDILVGNAAILGKLGPLGHVKPRDWDKVMAINVTANWRLIRSFDPLLRASDSGRAIFVTSGVGSTPYWGPYAASKAALETMVEVYAGEVAKTSMKVNLVDPGVVRTGMRASAFPGEDPSTLPAPETITDTFVELASVSCKNNGDIVRAR